MKVLQTLVGHIVAAAEPATDAVRTTPTLRLFLPLKGGATGLDPVGRILSLADLVLPTIRYGSIGDWTRRTMRKPVIRAVAPSD